LGGIDGISAERDGFYVSRRIATIRCRGGGDRCVAENGERDAEQPEGGDRWVS
jgi:hypothetical protein